MADIDIASAALSPRNMNRLVVALFDLTKVIASCDSNVVAHGLLGGESGYWDCDLFQMHPYCWCEREDCPWCAGCDCPASAFHYLVDGNEVSCEKYCAFFTRMTGVIEDTASAHDLWMRRAHETNRRRIERHDPVCDYCTGRGIFVGHPAGRGAPNFWHKSSGLRVWWYKHIGRGMEVYARSSDDPATIVRKCIAALRKHDVVSESDGK